MFDKKQKKTNIKREFSLLKKTKPFEILLNYTMLLDTNFNNIYFMIIILKFGTIFKTSSIKRKILQIFKTINETKYFQIIYCRDLKPQNILLTDAYDIKLTVFGFKIR